MNTEQAKSQAELWFDKLDLAQQELKTATCVTWDFDGGSHNPDEEHFFYVFPDNSVVWEQALEERDRYGNPDMGTATPVGAYANALAFFDDFASQGFMDEPCDDTDEFMTTALYTTLVNEHNFTPAQALKAIVNTEIDGESEVTDLVKTLVNKSANAAAK
jgi:hypothetical protein